MKIFHLKFSISLIWIVLLCLPVTGQETRKNGEKRPYISNSGFFDNTYIGAGGGINILTGDYDISHIYDSFGGGTTTNFNTNNITPSIDVFFGKWWTPAVGMRLAYHGYSLSGYTKDTNGPFVSQDWDMLCGHVREEMNYNSGRIDITLNLCNAIQGYRSDRFWDVIPYIGFGAANINGKNIRTGIRTNQWHISGDIGILNNLRLSKRWAVTLDLRYVMSDNWFDLDVSADNHKIDGILAASAGIAVKLGKVGFSHSETPDYSSYENQLTNYRQQMDDVNAALAAREKQISDLKGALSECGKNKNDSGIKESAIILYFALNSSKLDKKELGILDSFMKHKFTTGKVTVKATADSEYGSKDYNLRLSRKRAEYLANLLKEKYGVTVNASEGVGEVDTHTDPVLNRTGIINVSFE